MKQNLVAPPPVTVRNFAIGVAWFSAFGIISGVVLTAMSLLSVSEFFSRVAMIAAIGTGMVWAYAGVLRYSAKIKPERLPLFHAGFSATAMIISYVSLNWMVSSTAFEAAAPSAWWMMPLIVGTVLIQGGVSRRVGESLHCPSCEYEFGFTDAEDAPAKCPECGYAWIGRLKKGRRLRSTRLIVTGIVVAVTGAIVGNPIFYMKSVAPLLPTSVLIAGTYTSAGTLDDLWNELEKRPLSDATINRLAERMLPRRGRIARDYGPGGWLDAMIAQGKLSQAQLERYYRDGLRAELYVPKRVKAGEEFEVSLRVRHAASASGSGSYLGVIFGGYDFGEGTARVGRRDATMWAHELDPPLLESARDVIREKLKVDQAGEVRVRATYWLVYFPSFWDSVIWQADGTPVTPPGVSWFERIELEERVRVE